MIIRLAGAGYALPEASEEAATVLQRERARVDAALTVLTPSLRARVESGLGIGRVRVCRPGESPLPLANSAARQALARAGLRPADVDLIVDYSTLPDIESAHRPLAHVLASDLGLEASLNLNLRFSGCAGFHLAVKLASSLMNADERLRVALLVAADSAPEGSRSLLPITIQGDGASACVLSCDAARGPEIVGTEILTLGGLYGLIEYVSDSRGMPELRVDARRIEEEVLPVYYLHFHRLVHKLLGDSGVPRETVAHVVYGNVSRSDRDGFARSLGFDPRIVHSPGLEDCGHTFASDLVLNYTRLEASGAVKSGDRLLFAAAGIGFTWGVTLARV